MGTIVDVFLERAACLQEREKRWLCCYGMPGLFLTCGILAHGRRRISRDWMFGAVRHVAAPKLARCLRSAMLPLGMDIYYGHQRPRLVGVDAPLHLFPNDACAITAIAALHALSHAPFSHSQSTYLRKPALYAAGKTPCCGSRMTGTKAWVGFMPDIYRQHICPRRSLLSLFPAFCWRC